MMPAQGSLIALHTVLRIEVAPQSVVVDAKGSSHCGYAFAGHALAVMLAHIVELFGREFHSCGLRCDDPLQCISAEAGPAFKLAQAATIDAELVSGHESGQRVGRKRLERTRLPPNSA